MISTAAELKDDIRDLEARHDALVRAIDRKHAELDSVHAQIKAASEKLTKIEAAIKAVKNRFGV
jgi:chromosome segregation ATPase